MVKNGFIPETLEECLQILRNENVKIYAGGTDLMVPEDTAEKFLFLHRIPQLKEIDMENEMIRIGSCATFSDLEESHLMPTMFRDCMKQLAGPAIRNIGTIGGNIANGSSKADSVLLLYAVDASVRVIGVDGERVVPIEKLYENDTALKPEELIVDILIPNRNYENYYYHKVGPRKALAISRVDFCSFVEIDKVIVHFAAAFGAVMKTVVRNKELDAQFCGKTIEEARAWKASYLQQYDTFLQPTSGRVSKEYRKQVSMNLLKDALDQFFH